MNRYRNAPGLRGPTKASSTTLCQKCLKRDNYECKASNQERPYISRPSRTQQLQNPSLVPKLSSDTQNDLLQTEGIADGILSSRQHNRGQKRLVGEGNVELDEEGDRSRKRVRSISSHSSDSVSTISTNLSRSRSRSSGLRREFDGEEDVVHSIRGRSSPSPRESARRKRRYSESSSSYSPSRDSTRQTHPIRIGDRETERHTRRRRRESSPYERGRQRTSSIRGRDRDRSESQSDGQERFRGARKASSRTPSPGRGPHHRRDRHSAGVHRSSGRHPQHVNGNGPKRDRESSSHDVAPGPARRERSLSPFSKRLALTQAMNMGR